MRVAVLQNHPAEGPAQIQNWAEKNDIALEVFAGFEGIFPSSRGHDGIVIMGGPSSVHDAASDPNIARAIECVSEFLDSGKPTLGICLGAQMMSIASGGKVVTGPQKEIGWFPLTIPQGKPTNLSEGFPDQLVACHWHGEQIIPPSEALVFASTSTCPVQALQLAPNQLGLQFHLEVSREALETMTTEFADELNEADFGVQSVTDILAGFENHGESCERYLALILQRIFAPSV